MNRRNVTLQRRCAQAVSALVILLSAISVGAPPHADESPEFSREVFVGDATVGVTLEDWGTTYPAYGILDGLVSLADGSASLTPDLKSLTVVAPSAAPADDGEAVLPWEEAAPVIARALALRDEVDPVLPGGDMDAIHVGDHSLFVPPALITSARLASAGLLDKFAKRRSVRRKLYAAAALRAVTLEEAQQFDETLGGDLAVLQSGAVTMLGATNYVASSGLDVYTLLRIIAGKQAAAHGASTAAVAAKVTQRVSASALGKSVKALGVLAFAVDLAEGISESRARQRLLAAAAADALLIASLEDARRLLEAEDADPAMIEGLSDAIGQLTSVSQTRQEEYAEVGTDALAGSLPSLAATVVAYLGTGGAALVVREAAELGKELIGYTREVLTVSAMATLGRVLRPRIEALVVGDAVGGTAADAYAMRELVALHDRLGAEATASVYNMLWTDRWKDSSSLAGIARGAGLSIAEWLTADAGPEEAFKDEAAWRVRRVREGAAFAAAMPQILGELQAHYVGPAEEVAVPTNAAEDAVADQIAPERRVLFSEDFESYAVGSRPAHYIVVHDGLGTSEQRVEAEGGNRHLRTAAQASWSLHMREDFAFDLPDVVSVSWRMRVDKDLDWYSYTRPNGARYAHLGSFSVKNADEFAASISINKRETDRKIAAWCPEGDGKEFELQLGVWTEFRAVVDFASGRQLRYANGELFCDTATSFVDLSGRWNSWGEAPGIRFGSGNSGTSVTRFDDIVIRAIGEDEKGETMGALEPAAARPVDCAGWDSDWDSEGYASLESFYGNITPSDVLACLKTGIDPNAELPEQGTALHNAAYFSGSPAVIAALLDAGADANARDVYGRTPLHLAIDTSKSPAFIAVLLDAGADPSADNEFLGMPLQSEIQSRSNPAVIAALLDAGADANARDTLRNTPLSLAARRHDNLAVVTTLLDAGADVNGRDSRSNTPLHNAVSHHGDLAIIAALLDAGADVNARDWGENTPLHTAARWSDYPDVIAALLDAGADPTERDDDGNTALDVAQSEDRPAGIIAALAGEASVVEEGDVAAAPKIPAAPSGDCAEWNSRDWETLSKFYGDITLEQVAACLDAGADPNARDREGRTPLHYAARHNQNHAIIAALLEAGADINARTESERTPLHLAARWSDNPAIIAALLKSGADPNAREDGGRTPLEVATLTQSPAAIIAMLEEATRDVEEAGSDAGPLDAKTPPTVPGFRELVHNPHLIEELLVGGADPSTVVEGGLSLLHMAAGFLTDPKVVKGLIEAGADPNARTEGESGMTLLQAAARYNPNSGVIEMLLDAGADPHARDKLFGLTALHTAARFNENAAITQRLLDAGADPDARGKDGITPLHRAAAHNSTSRVVKLLLGAGADPMARDAEGRTPLDIARTEGNSAKTIVELEEAITVARANASNAGSSVPQASFSSQRIITTEAGAASDVHAADLDGDGDPDVLSASFGDDTISWYENQGSGVFSRQRVITRDANGARSVFAADLDGDGDADVLSASWHDNMIAWYENQGGGSFSSQRVITSRAHGALSVHAADLDGDGDTDVVSASHRSARQMIAWYENHGDGTFTGRVITRDATGARSVFVTDLDNDGYADVLSASAWDDKIAWYRNVGGGEFSSGQIITTEGVGASSVIAADLDGDGDADVLSGWVGDKKVAWYRNSGTGTFSGQRIIFSSQHYIETDNVVRTPLFASDLDGDGDEDVLSAPLWDDEIVWYENLGGGAFAGQRLITKDVEAVHSVFAADLDGDGNLDVLSASFNDNKIAWYENLSPDREDRPVEAALSEPSQEPDTLAGRVVGGIADWLEQRFGSGGVRFALAAPIRAEEDGDDTVTVHLPGARLVERDGGYAYAFGDLALEVTAENDTEYGFDAALPSVMEMFTGSGQADGRVTVDDSEISGVWRSDHDGATALDATVSNVRTFTDTGQQQLELDSLEISSEVDQGSDALWDGEATINLSDLSYTPGPSNEGVRLGRLDVTATVEDADVGPFMAMSRTGVATAVGSELETLQETLALFSQGGFGRAEVAIALRDLVAIDGGEVVLDLGNLDWLVVFDDREEFTDLAMTIEAAELEINEDATEGFPVELIPNAATVDIALMRYPLRQIAGELQELTRTSGTQAIERALEQVAVTAMAEAGTAFEIRDIRIVGPSIGIEAEGLFQVDTQSALGASGHTNIRIRGFGRVMEWAAEQREADMVNFLVFLKGLGEPLYNESDDLPTYAYSLEVLRDGSITVNDVPLERLLESLQ